MFCVYKITNLINNKVYIGKTSKGYNKNSRKYGLEQRWLTHVRISKNPNNSKFKLIHAAINKYDNKNFKIEELKEYQLESDAYKAEIKFIKKFKSNNRKFGYNLNDGGKGGNTGFKHTEATKIKIGLAQKGVKHWNYGKSVSQEKRKHLSDLAKQRYKYTTHPRKNKKASDKTRLLLSKAAKLRTGNKNPFYGKKHSTEARLKIKQAAIKRHQVGK